MGVDDSLGAVLQRGRHALAQGPYGDIGEARLLLSWATGLTKEETLVQEDRILAASIIQKFEEALVQRQGGCPIARILGEKEFFGLTFSLNPHTLVPRPDSECLVTAGLAFLDSCQRNASQTLPSQSGDFQPQILDLGTGSGCLLLSLLSHHRTARGLGVDISSDAITQATDNAHHLALQTRSTFRCTDWYAGLSQGYKVDLIISNPPYISTAEIATLSPEVREHDPIMALEGGMSGTAPYAEIIQQAPRFLKPGGMLMVEIGWTQRDNITALFQQAGFTDIFCGQDLGARDRFVQGLYNG